jgi:hypothetical protein
LTIDILHSARFVVIHWALWSSCTDVEVSNQHIEALAGE